MTTLRAVESGDPEGRGTERRRDDVMLGCRYKDKTVTVKGESESRTTIKATKRRKNKRQKTQNQKELA